MKQCSLLPPHYVSLNEHYSCQLLLPPFKTCVSL